MSIARSIQFGLVVASLAWAAPGRPCDLAPPDLSTVIVPWEGHDVPKNATLQLLRGNNVVGELVGPDDVVRNVRWPDDDTTIVEPALDAAGLQVGRHTLTLRFDPTLGEDRRSRAIVFGVEDRVDDDAADLRFSITRSTIGRAPWEGEALCGGGQPAWPTTLATISLDEADADEDIAWLELDSGERRRLNDGTLELIDDGTYDFGDIVAVDFAGNRSAVVPEAATGGCGCSTAEAPVGAVGAAALGLLALLRRRR